MKSDCITSESYQTWWATGAIGTWTSVLSRQLQNGKTLDIFGSQKQLFLCNTVCGSCGYAEWFTFTCAYQKFTHQKGFFGSTEQWLWNNA